MSVNSVNNASNIGSNYAPERKQANMLGKDDFLKLLVTQLKYQDPMNPADSTQFVSQLAQFSALEQMSNMSAGIASMQALSMTGKYITATVTDSKTGQRTEISGVVDSVEMKGGQATLMVNGQRVRIEDVTNVYDYDRSAIQNLSSLIGKTCKGSLK
jgi:flagellar basal-body rod modification protein FlgD